MLMVTVEELVCATITGALFDNRVVRTREDCRLRRRIGNLDPNYCRFNESPLKISTEPREPETTVKADSWRSRIIQALT
jgi:hypothetical protein